MCGRSDPSIPWALNHIYILAYKLSPTFHKLGSNLWKQIGCYKRGWLICHIQISISTGTHDALMTASVLLACQIWPSMIGWNLLVWVLKKTWPNWSGIYLMDHWYAKFLWSFFFLCDIFWLNLDSRISVQHWLVWNRLQYPICFVIYTRMASMASTCYSWCTS